MTEIWYERYKCAHDVVERIDGGKYYCVDCGDEVEPSYLEKTEDE